MAQSSFPFEGIDTTETQFSQMFRHLQDGVNGTYGGTELTVAAGAGLTVDVQAGQAMVRGHYYISTAVENRALATADATNPRLDMVVLRLDPVLNSIIVAVKTGTPAGSPVAPALVQTDSGVWEMALATVLVPALAGVPSTVSDLREFMGTRISLWTDATRPTTVMPHVGYNVDQGTFEGYDVVTTVWGPIGGGGGVTISATAPVAPAAGDLWWDSVNGELYVFYDDGTSSQWVAAAGPSVTVASVAPTGYEGQLWLDDTDGSMYVYYTDPGGGSSSWIGAVSRSGGILQVVSTTKTDTFSASVTAGASVAVTGLSITHSMASASNKLLITAFFGNAANSGQRGQVGLAVADDGTLLALGDTGGSRTSVMTGGRTGADASSTSVVNSPSGTFLYAPGDTASHTYTLHAINPNTVTQTIYINRTSGDTDFADVTRAASALTIMEVAG